MTSCPPIDCWAFLKWPRCRSSGRRCPPVIDNDSTICCCSSARCSRFWSRRDVKFPHPFLSLGWFLDAKTVFYRNFWYLIHGGERRAAKKAISKRACRAKRAGALWNVAIVNNYILNSFSLAIRLLRLLFLLSPPPTTLKGEKKCQNGNRTHLVVEKNSVR